MDEIAPEYDVVVLGTGKAYPAFVVGAINKGNVDTIAMQV